GVLADQNMPFVQPQLEKRVEAMRLYPQVFAQREKLAPQRDGFTGRMMQLIGNLARKAEAAYAAWYARDHCHFVREIFWRIIQPCARQQLGGERASHVYRTERHSLIHQMDIQTP